METLHVLFERDQFRYSSLAGRKFLRGHIETLPDNHSVETGHLGVKIDARKNVNHKQRAGRMQQLVQGSGILEERGVKHTAAVDRETFVREFRGEPTCSSENTSAQERTVTTKPKLMQ